MKRGWRGGFTIVELLVVVVILAILAGLLTAGIAAALRSARKRRTETVLATLSAAIESYKTAFQDYPPSSITERDRRWRAPNERNQGIEALVASLTTRAGGGPFYAPSRPEEVYSNTDEDSVPGMSLEDMNWTFGDTQLREVMDSWSQPIFYFHWRDCPNPRQELTTNHFAEGDATWRPTPNPATKAFPTAFVLFSAGPDGRPDAGADIRLER